jgi:hypothetical protein
MRGPRPFLASYVPSGARPTTLHDEEPVKTSKSLHWRLLDGEVPQASQSGTGVTRGSVAPVLFFKGRVMDQVIGIIGQAVLVVMGLVLLAFLLLLLFAIIRGIKRLLHDLRQPLLPESDLIIPEPFDQP